MSQLYPLKFKNILKERIWGGNKLAEVLGKKKSKNGIGESWELSGVEGDISVIANGFLQGNNLEEIIEIYMGDLVGDKVYDQFGLQFPLLIKFIDANDDLSIQVHPNDALAAERHNSYGKTEMWYVLEANAGAELISGFNKPLNKDEYLTHLENKTLGKIMYSQPVQKGDTFFIPAGRVHAIGKGILIAEIQQTSDITYRIYDYDRLDKSGLERELHTEEALDAIDYTYVKEVKTLYPQYKNGSVQLATCQYFTTNKLVFDQPMERDYIELDSFVVYICCEGSFEIKADGIETVPVTKGETVLLPASLKNIMLQPLAEVELLEVYIKNKD